MAIDIYDLSFFQDDYSEEEELTEEERLKLQLEELGLEAEEDEALEAEIAATELSVEDEVEDEEPLDDSIYNLEFFQEDSEQEKIEGKQLEYQGDAEGIPFYYDPDTKHYEVSSIPDNEVILTTCPARAEEILEEFYENYNSRKST